MATFSGPMFGDPNAIVKVHLDQMRLVVADVAEVRARGHLSTHQRVQTGFNVSHVRTENRSADITAVHNTNATYGPWIEGIGSRNRTTRFKGYHSFRVVGQQMREQAGSLIRPHVRALVGELNG